MIVEIITSIPEKHSLIQTRFTQMLLVLVWYPQWCQYEHANY